MHCNVGDTDRIIRISAGVTFLTIGLREMDLIWGVIGALLLISGMMRFCFLYRIMGCKTSCSMDACHTTCETSCDSDKMAMKAKAATPAKAPAKKKKKK